VLAKASRVTELGCALSVGVLTTFNETGSCRGDRPTDVTSIVPTYEPGLSPLGSMETLISLGVYSIKLAEGVGLNNELNLNQEVVVAAV
jgi:hypothetical protein